MNKQSSGDLWRLYQATRSNLLIVAVLSLVNVVFFLFSVERVFLFSATIPYYAVVFGFSSGIPMLKATSLVFSLATVALYVLFWFYSKRNYRWMIAALALFSLDTAALFVLMFSPRGTWLWSDVLFHGLILFYLILGIVRGRSAEKTSSSGEPVGETQDFSRFSIAQIPPEGSETVPLRIADPDVKHKVLLQTEYEGRTICYRRVKSVNELVINGSVYDELSLVIQPSHVLSARIGGTLYQAGFDGIGHSFICVDGRTVAKKVRLF